MIIDTPPAHHQELHHHWERCNAQMKIFGEQIQKSQRKTLGYIRKLGDALLEAARIEYQISKHEEDFEKLKQSAFALDFAIKKGSQSTGLSRDLLRASFWDASKRDHDPDGESIGSSRMDLENYHKQANKALPLFFDQRNETDLNQIISLGKDHDPKRIANQVYMIDFGQTFKVGKTCDGPQRFDQLKVQLNVDEIKPYLIKEYANAGKMENMALNFLRAEGLSITSSKKEIFLKHPPAFQHVYNLLSGNPTEQYQFVSLELTQAQRELTSALVNCNLNIKEDGYRKVKVSEWSSELVSIGYYFFGDPYYFKSSTSNFCIDMMRSYENLGLSEVDLRVRGFVLSKVQTQRDKGAFNASV